jgi:hypothetical protein
MRVTVRHGWPFGFAHSRDALTFFPNAIFAIV